MPEQHDAGGECRLWARGAGDQARGAGPQDPWDPGPCTWLGLKCPLPMGWPRRRYRAALACAALALACLAFSMATYSSNS